MNFSKRILSAVLVVVMCITMLYMGNQVKVEEEKNIFDHAETLHIWYTDEALTDYLGSMAVKFNEEQGIRVIPVLQSGLELLENINAASLSKESTPDLFIATNEIFRKVPYMPLRISRKLSDTPFITKPVPCCIIKLT